MTPKPSVDYRAQTSVFWRERSREGHHYIRSDRSAPHPSGADRQVPSGISTRNVAPSAGTDAIDAPFLTNHDEVRLAPFMPQDRNWVCLQGRRSQAHLELEAARAVAREAPRVVGAGRRAQRGTAGPRAKLRDTSSDAEGITRSARPTLEETVDKKN